MRKGKTGCPTLRVLGEVCVDRGREPRLSREKHLPPTRESHTQGCSLMLSRKTWIPRASRNPPGTGGKGLSQDAKPDRGSSGQRFCGRWARVPPYPPAAAVEAVPGLTPEDWVSGVSSVQRDGGNACRREERAFVPAQLTPRQPGV